MQGCLTCKDRHVRCDEGRPVCQNCIKVNRECVQRDGSRALPSSTSSDTTAANTPNTTAACSTGAASTVDDLRVTAENSNTSESAKAANTVNHTNLKALSKYKENEIDPTDQDHDINKLVQGTKNIRRPQTAIMNKKTVPQSKSPVPAMDGNEQTSKPTTTPKPNDPKLHDNKNTPKSTLGPRFVSSLSLASTTTNRPPPASFTPLKPITHWVPPRPKIIARTELSDAEKAELYAEDAARKVEKEAAKLQKKKEVEMMVARAGEAQMRIRAQELGGFRDCPHGTCDQSVAGCKCVPRQMGDEE